MLTTAQLAILKAAIIADPTLDAWPNNADGNFEIAAALNQIAVPDFYVWRSNVSLADIYHKVSGEGTSWSWTTYKAQSVTEQGSWVQMFYGDAGDFNLDNMRSGVEAIFSGTPGSAQGLQRAHVYAAAKRKATRGTKLFAVGTGSLAVPAELGVGTAGEYIEGRLSTDEIERARLLP